jgi:very-short-patch-repair endonuclease
MGNLDRQVAALAAQQYGALSRHQLIETGLSAAAIDHRVRAGSLERVHLGVYRVAGAPNSWRHALMAVCLIEGGAVASHRAAARLWNLRGFQEAPLEVTVPRRKAAVTSGVICHITDTFPAIDISMIDGIPTTSAARTLAGLGAVVPRAVGPALNDAVLKGLVTYPWMWRTVGRLSARGRNGIGVLRAELERHDPSDAPTESMLEDLFVKVTRRAGLSLPRQVRVGHLRVDFADPLRKVIVELDGRKWHDAEADRVRDRRRELQLRAAGWRVIRVRWLDLKYWPELVIAELQQAFSLPATA